jgi:hypothetical protein
MKECYKEKILLCISRPMTDSNKPDSNKNLNDKHEQIVVTLRVKKTIVELIDKDRAKFSTPRSSWITQAAVEKLEKLGYDIE